ncbi:MAG: transcriptional repressor [Actinobacteria bacterium]|nr:transcriptional repressor [Actinomycetota bacterium]NBY15369.1 transcriptional repressor [Actinomycetota bacterium]
MSRDWDEVLREHGYRITPQRQLVLEAVNALGHATPETLLAEVQKTAGAVNLSTIYRTLEVLEQVGLVTHAHIGHGPPTYHSVDEDPHIHLVCDTCSSVDSIPAESATLFVQLLRDQVGFETDVAHVSVHGQCADCVKRLKYL